VKCKILVIAAVFGTTLATVFSQDLSGEWVAEFADRNGRTTKMVFELNVDGATLTGAVLGGYREEERPILKGKVKGEKISFILEDHAGKRAISYIYEGKISGDTIKFTVTVGGRRVQAFTARKANQ
jgi:hypothetical protein